MKNTSLSKAETSKVQTTTDILNGESEFNPNSVSSIASREPDHKMNASYHCPDTIAKEPESNFKRNANQKRKVLEGNGPKEIVVNPMENVTERNFDGTLLGNSGTQSNMLDNDVSPFNSKVKADINNQVNR